MFDGAHFIGQVPLQDADLLQRLNQYFSTLDFRLRQGQGWVIYNAAGPRAGRITRFLQDALRSADTPFSHFFLPWRDFALTSYLVEVELRGDVQQDNSLSEKERQEHAIATRVSTLTLARMLTADLLVLNGLAPRYPHEVTYLDETIERRCKGRLSTILLTPDQPHELALSVTRLADQGEQTWSRMSSRLYETSLIAV